MAAGTDYATKSDVRALESKLDVNVRALDKKLDATQADVRALDKKLDATQADVRALDKKLDATRHDLTALVESTRDGLDAKINRVGVFLERLEAKVDSIIETLPAKASATEVHSLHGELEKRVSLLENVTRETSADVRKNSKDVRLLRTEVARLRKTASRK